MRSAVVGAVGTFLVLHDLQLSHGFCGGARDQQLGCRARRGSRPGHASIRSEIDPAVSSAVFVTTITDVMGFFSFLGLAALFLTR